MNDIIKNNNQELSISNLSTKLAIINKLLQVSEKKIINFDTYSDSIDRTLIKLILKEYYIESLDSWESLEKFGLYNLKSYKIFICHYRIIWTENDLVKFKNLIYKNPDINFIVRSMNIDTIENMFNDIPNVFTLYNLNLDYLRSLVHKCNQNNNNFQSIL